MVRGAFFEIPVRDLEREVSFYEAPVAMTMEREVLYPKTETGAYGFVAEFADSEGNCTALLEGPP